MGNSKNKTPWYTEESGLFSNWYFDVFGVNIRNDRAAEESDFLVKALGLKKGSKILDLCCGYGRITNELAGRGYNMTGQDISKYFMDMAKKNSAEKNLNVRWVNSDMRNIPFKNEFDAVINMFTAFGYFENDEEDEKVIKEINKSLKKGGKFLIDFINRDFVIRRYKFDDTHEFKNGFAKIKRNFDFIRNSHSETIDVFIDGKLVKKLYLDFRFYCVSELTAMMKRNGFKVLTVYGGFNFRPLTFETSRCIILTEKI